jgi:hypothetical protein
MTVRFREIIANSEPDLAEWSKPPDMPDRLTRTMMVAPATVCTTVVKDVPEFRRMLDLHEARRS